MQVVLAHLGVTSVIAHIKIGQMHAALESKVIVESAQGQCANNSHKPEIADLHDHNEVQCDTLWAFRSVIFYFYATTK